MMKQTEPSDISRRTMLLRQLTILFSAGLLVFSFFLIRKEITTLKLNIRDLEISVSINEQSFSVVHQTLLSLQKSHGSLLEKIEMCVNDDVVKMERIGRSTTNFDGDSKKRKMRDVSLEMIEDDSKSFFGEVSKFTRTHDWPMKDKHLHNRKKELSRKLEMKQIYPIEAGGNSNGKYPFTVEIYHDKDFLETKWELVSDESNERIFLENIVTVNNAFVYTFSNFIEAGSYTFSIFDSYGDGIRCKQTKNSGCYNVYIGNEKMEGLNFSLQTSQSFSISNDKLCIGKLFQLELDLDKGIFETNIELYEKETDKILFYESIRTDENMNSVTKCIQPGYYTLSILDSAGNILGYDEDFSDDQSFKIFIDNEELMIERTNSAATVDFFVTVDGNAQSPKCQQFPILSPINHLNRDRYEEAIEYLLNTIYGLSSLESLNNRNTPQYRAACFILFDDVRNMTIADPGLIERYSLSVLLYSTSQLPEVHLAYDTCNSFDVKCSAAGSITEVHFPFRGMKGYLSNEVAHFRFLETINFASNQFVGTIPTEMGSLLFLKELNLSENNLEGTIPTEIGRLHKLQRFDLRRNSNIMGTIPTEIGKCKSLTNFGIASSHVGGTIPPQLFDATKLEWLYILDNELTGTIPSNIGQLENMVSFIAGTNNLSGSIPTEISKLSSIVNIWLQNNNLSGTIPGNIRNCHQIMELIIKDNKLTGTLPDIFDNLKSLRWLDAANNYLTGSIPGSLWNNKFTPSFERYNLKKGDAPEDAFWVEDDKAILNLEGNDLRGNVPDSFCAKMDEIFLDTHKWFLDYPKVSCSCCKSTDQCYLWNSEEEMTTCSNESNMKIFKFSLNIEILDIHTNHRLAERGSTRAEVNTCLSPTGCYKVSRLNENEQLIGYANTSSYHGLVENRCDAVNVCGYTIHSSHPKRIGLNHLMQTVVPGVHVLDDPESPHYKALCWIINDEMFHEFKICDGTLLQRYAIVVSLFYQGDSSTSTELIASLSEKMTCEWDFLTCDRQNNTFVERVELPNKNLTTFNPEFGRLHRLEIFNARQNKLSGTMDPSTFQSLPNLKSLDLSFNSFIGAIPKELIELRKLQMINLSYNRLSGGIPDIAIFPENLESISVGNNLLQGFIPHGLNRCYKLRHIDLSRNNFQGTIPSEFGKMVDLRTFKLYENGFTGIIPPEIFRPMNIESIMLQSNSLTGSIPSEISNLTKAASIALNHNRLKGTIPRLDSLRNIEFLHFHHNELTGEAPKVSKKSFVNNTIRNYITDCGTPYYALPGPLICETCTMCCNSDERCQKVQEWELSITATGILISALVPLVLIFLCFCRILLFTKCLPEYGYNGKHQITMKSSVYQFVLSSDVRAKAIFALTGFVQFLLFFFYLGPSELKSEDTDFQFSFICPNNDTDCVDMNSVSSAGWVMFVFVTFTYLGTDIIRGYQEICTAVYDRDIWLLLSGCMIFFMTILALFTSMVYNIALAESNTDLIMNAVILLFINDLDEKISLVTETIAPEWTARINEEIRDRMLAHSILLFRYRSMMQHPAYLG